jgi:two-component system phosphate regulon sensor histidine kinase PhoR
LHQHSFAYEVRRFIGFLIFALIIGLLLGNIFYTLVAGLILYIFYQSFNLYTLTKWLQKRNINDIPDIGGLWAETYRQLVKHKRRETREKNRLKAVINQVEATTTALNDAVILISPNNELRWWNQATNVLLDLKPTDVGNNLINFIRNPQFVNYLEAGDYSIPVSLPSPRDMEKQLEYQITRFGEGEGLLVVRDVTRIYKLEKMRKDFVANVSHELRTPLTVIRGYLETLEDSPDPALKSNQHVQKALSQMQQQSTRMTTLINDLTMLSKLETDPENKKPQEVLLKPLLEMICSEARAISQNAHANNDGSVHQISFDCEDNFLIIGNDRELHSAFSNLITNAVKYSPPDKPVFINVSQNDEDELIVSVKDQGIGIEQQHINRLTERFYRVDSSRSIQTGGTGLGLAIVKHILLRHDARLDIDSDYGKGSKFSCIFPSHRVSVV